MVGWKVLSAIAEKIVFTGQGEPHSLQSDLWTVWCAYEVHFCQIVNHTTLSGKTWKTNGAELWLQVSAVSEDLWG